MTGWICFLGLHINNISNILEARLLIPARINNEDYVDSPSDIIIRIKPRAIC